MPLLETRPIGGGQAHTLRSEASRCPADLARMTSPDMRTKTSSLTSPVCSSFRLRTPEPQKKENVNLRRLVLISFNAPSSQDTRPSRPSPDPPQSATPPPVGGKGRQPLPTQSIDGRMSSLELKLKGCHRFNLKGCPLIGLDRLSSLRFEEVFAELKRS
ncbi:unnamed protein product [Cyprideis torosa]|uniref:Uncharacterized protein n=1 Tax=Cyprideis torosa TaxID=163714 RepID=A0A7R8WQ48_9CRUS|nr:unnamed protein product [Cyprideis torosa]CAG0907732.1 unnamed protein product [Cyprideis torosa]